MYADLSETASSLIAEFGQSAKLRRMASVYDPVTGTSTDTSTDYPCDILEQDINSVALFSSSLAPGSLVSESDRFFMLASDTPPANNDRLVIGSLVLVIQGVRPLAPGGVAVYYTVRARG